MTRAEFLAAVDALPRRGDLLDATFIEKESTMNKINKTPLSVAVAAALSLAACATLAEEPKYLEPGSPSGHICPRGQAMSYLLACDPGSRIDVQVVFPIHAPGASVCRAQQLGCMPIPGMNANARPGFEVRDSFRGDELVGVTFGLDSLLGEAPAQSPRP